MRNLKNLKEVVIAQGSRYKWLSCDWTPKPTLPATPWEQPRSVDLRHDQSPAGMAQWVSLDL